jgi:hypothetical protein
MKNAGPGEFEFEIDRLTNSIQNVISGDSFDTVISLIIDELNAQKLITKYFKS